MINPHNLIPVEYGRLVEESLRAAASVRFSALKEGVFYYYLGGAAGLYGEQKRRIVRVVKVSPKGRKAMFAIAPDFGHLEAQSLEYPGEFFEVSETQIALAMASHRSVVQKALAEGKEISPEVRRFYPELFVALPEGVTSEEVLTLMTGWKSLTTSEDVGECIASTHESIRVHDQTAAMVINRMGAKEPQFSQTEMDKARASLVERLGLYTWLAPLVSPGGVFHVPQAA